MSTSKGKRRMPRREIPWIESFSTESLTADSKLPTKHVVLQRLFLLLEHSSSPALGESARTTVRDELMSVWEYVGFDDVLKEPSNIKPLHQKYRSLSLNPFPNNLGLPSRKRERSSSNPSLGFLTSQTESFYSITGTRRFILLGTSKPRRWSRRSLPVKPHRESCTPRSTGTTITVPTDIIKKIGPAADRLGASNSLLQSPLSLTTVVRTSTT